METELNRQQICAALGVSESTIRRLEGLGLPFTPVGVRSKRYNLDECKTWLRTQYAPRTDAQVPAGQSRDIRKMGNQFIESCKGQKLRVYPS
jgi:phage terminase Nu1 subunit (DNA packaging protein)